MSNITTIQKGDELEDRAFNLLQSLLNNDEFFVTGKRSKIFKKRGYFSSKRNSNIVFDLAIETYLNNASNYSLLTLIECKNLKRKVSVDDIEEFDSKIRQIGEHNTRGVFISNNAFQEAAFNLAVALKIMIIRIGTDDKYEMINYRKAKSINIDREDIRIKFVKDHLHDEKFIATINNKVLTNFADVLLEGQIIDYYTHKEQFINIPFVSQDKINDIISGLNKHGIYAGRKVDTDKLCQFLKTVYQLEFDFNADLPNNILGKIEFEPLRISISGNLKADLYRWRFTLAHEIGHLILHSSLLSGRINEKIDNESSSFLNDINSEINVKKLELQANIFASYLLLPFESLLNCVAEYFVAHNIYKGYVFLDSQPCNQKLVFTLLNKISNEYQVSIEVARIRLANLGLLKDGSNNLIRNILKNNFSF